MIKKVGFEAGYLSGGGVSVTLLGKPDIGLLTLDELTRTVQHITAVFDLPLLVDADTGFGGEANVQRTVQELENAGAGGIQIEDQEFPKRCGHLAGKSLIPKEEMVRKIKVAVRSRKNNRLAIVARTDARGVTGMRDALERAAAYKKAGADIIFPEALQSKAEFQAFSRKKTLGTLLANMTEFGQSPALTVDELAHLGYRLVLFPMTACRVSAFSMEKALTDLKTKGTSQQSLPVMQTRKELYSLINYEAYESASKPTHHRRKKG